LREAQYATEELEETAKMLLMLRGEKIRPLTQEQRDDLLERHG
jgi:ribulose-5-phosphate 4-epimerase/fuculose-1-phosphate aldolase